MAKVTQKAVRKPRKPEHYSHNRRVRATRNTMWLAKVMRQIDQIYLEFSIWTRTYPLLQIGMSVKIKKKKSNSIDRDETAQYDLHCLHSKVSKTFPTTQHINRYM